MTSAVVGTVSEALGSAADAIAAAGADSPQLDAALLLSAATGLDRARLAAEPELGVDAVAARAFGAMVRRRVTREPVAYILGRKGFRRIELEVDPRVLIPRPETELLVEVARELAPAAVLDVGTGSGAIALAIADELPAAAVTATDTSLDALAVAKRNRERLGFTERVRLAYGSLEPGPFDLVLANLPYVGEGEWQGLAAEIREFEPYEALVSGPTGLEAIEVLLADLGLGGSLPEAIALEVGAGQATIVAELVRRAGFERVETRPDLAGIERLVVGWL
ncbi:MAG TPA: peptide chain release factor N(5)-glutamine methyltransferase [Solirubrobacterales bacterium]|jgi:release factor glutamine methyltransferase